MELKHYISNLSVWVKSTHRALYSITLSSNGNTIHLQAIFVDCSVASQTTFLRDRGVPIEDILTKGRGKLGASVPKMVCMNSIFMQFSKVPLQETFPAIGLSLSFVKAVHIVVKAISLEPLIGDGRRVLGIKTTDLFYITMLIARK